jgi:hypothetical protein
MQDPYDPSVLWATDDLNAAIERCGFEAGLLLPRSYEFPPRVLRRFASGELMSNDVARGESGNSGDGGADRLFRQSVPTTGMRRPIGDGGRSLVDDFRSSMASRKFSWQGAALGMMRSFKAAPQAGGNVSPLGLRVPGKG